MKPKVPDYEPSKCHHFYYLYCDKCATLAVYYASPDDKYRSPAFDVNSTSFHYYCYHCGHIGTSEYASVYLTPEGLAAMSEWYHRPNAERTTAAQVRTERGSDNPNTERHNGVVIPTDDTDATDHSSHGTDWYADQHHSWWAGYSAGVANALQAYIDRASSHRV